MLILGLESTCDESAACILEYRGKQPSRILAHALRSQEEIHQDFGGVVPELAARAHLLHLDRLVGKTLAQAQTGWDAINAVAAAAGPGLIGGVMTGLLTGKLIALARDLPFIAVNHLEAHALSPRLAEKIDYPYLLLLISGGHSLTATIEGAGRYRVWGESRDDAAGEAFDKSARLLGLDYPGGAALEKLARRGQARHDLPRPLAGASHCDMSFAGLKSALRRLVEETNAAGGAGGKQQEKTRADLAAGFQLAAAESLAERSAKAMEFHLAHTGAAAPVFVAAGGVAANAVIRQKLRETAEKRGFRFSAPPPWLCTDNGAMIAYAGGEKLRAGITTGLDFPPRARWPL